MKIKTHIHLKRFTILVVGLLIVIFFPSNSVEALRSITFPIIGSTNYTNDYYAPRASGTHHATDVFAKKMKKVVSPVDGRISYVAYPQPSYGYMVSIRDDDGYLYKFIHLNNDRPGTDDGKGGGHFAFAPDVVAGSRVVKGQHIGYVGDSGNAENTPSHLHFEIFKPNSSKTVNPFESLNKAKRISKPALYPKRSDEILPYGNKFNGSVNITMGNLDLDQDSEQIIAPGPGGGPHIKTFEANDIPLGGFFAYNTNLRCGFDVAAGDVDGDGVDEIITGPGRGCGPHVRVFEANGTLIGGFFAYNSAARDGIRVAAGDVDGDGVDEIITVPGRGSGPHVFVRELDGTLVDDFFAYSARYRDGIDIAAGDVQGNSRDEIVTSPGPGGGPHVKIFDNGSLVDDFFAYSSTFRGGVNVSVGNVRENTAYEEILTIPNSAGGPHVRMFDGSGTQLSGNWLFESWWRGYYDIAAGHDVAKGSSGVNRRGTVRLGID